MPGKYILRTAQTPKLGFWLGNRSRPAHTQRLMDSTSSSLPAPRQLLLSACGYLVFGLAPQLLEQCVPVQGLPHVEFG